MGGAPRVPGASSASSEGRVAELKELCRTAGVRVMGVVEQRRPEADPKYLIGRGKLEEVLIRAMQVDANVLIFPNLAAGNIGYKLVKQLGHAETIGPILMGMRRPVSVLHHGTTVADIVNLTAITAVVADQIAAPRHDVTAVVADQVVAPPQDELVGAGVGM